MLEQPEIDNKMKITKSKLRQIIQEELKQVLSEQSDWHDDENETLADRKFAERDHAPPEMQGLSVSLKTQIRKAVDMLVNDAAFVNATAEDIAIQSLDYVNDPLSLSEEALAYAREFVQSNYGVQ